MTTSSPATGVLLDLAQQLLDAAHYCTELPRLESHCREIAQKLEALAEGAGDAAAAPQEPVAWQWRYVGEGDHQWKTPSGGHKISDEVLKRERPIEQRPLYFGVAQPSAAKASDPTCYIERSKVREILITSNIDNESTQEVLKEVDALRIFTADDFTNVAQTAPVPALAEFFKWAMREGPWEGGDLDGGSIQDKAESLGLIVKTKFDPERHGTAYGDFSEGGDYYEFAPGVSLPSTDRERGNRFCKNDDCPYPDCLVEGGVCPSQPSPDRGGK